MNNDLKRLIIITSTILIIYFCFSVYLHIATPKDVQIPNLIGLTTQEAEITVKSLGLKLHIESDSNNNFKDEIVVSQEPMYMENYLIKGNSILTVKCK